MTHTTTERADLAAGLAAYRLTPGLQLVDGSPFLELRCPHEITPGRPDAHTCVTNLLDRDTRMGGVQLRTLVSAALLHDDPEPTIERTRRLGVLLRQLGDAVVYTLYADVDEHPFLVMNCPYVGGRCPGSREEGCTANLIPDGGGAVDLGTVLRLATEHENARYGVPLDRLAAVRHAWQARLLAEVYTRESADGPSAHIASVRADLINRMIADLDQAMAGSHG